MRAGFTLVEIAIVLVIIGLIVGGILVGAEMILAAKQRKILSSIDSFRAAANTFQLKYGCSAGDCPFTTTLLTDSQNPLVNGDGNGLVDQDAEIFEFWHHLSAAGLVPGYYVGQTGGLAITRGINAPFINEYSYLYRCFSTQAFPYFVWNQIGCGMWVTNYFINSNLAGGPGFTITEAHAIDRKFDDGYASTGLIWGTRPSLGVAGITGTSCTTADAYIGGTTDGAYQPDSRAYQCVLIFK